MRPFLTFLLLAVTLRVASFFISVIDHDESTYIVIAREMLRGGVYLRDVIDTKPIGIFWIYEGLLQLTDGSIPLLRLATTLVIALGSLGLYTASVRATGQRTAGYVAGILYLFMCSIYAHYGMAPNTEHYFNTLTIWAVAVSVASPRKRWGLAGTLLGLAFLIKPFAAAEAGAVGLYLVWYYRRNLAALFKNGLLLVLQWALPILIVGVTFWANDLLAELRFYSLDVAAAYPVDLPWYLRLKYMGDYLLRYSPFVLWAIWAGSQVGALRKGKNGEWLTYLLLQFTLVTTVVLLTGKRFGHYQIQLHPVLSLLVGATAGVAYREVLRRRWVKIAVLVAAVGVGIGHAVYYGGKTDGRQQLADYLAPRLAPDETFLTLDGFQILYHLLDRPVPTPYVHSSLLFYGHHVQAFRIDERAEAARLLANPKLRFVAGRRWSGEDSELLRLVLEEFGAPTSVGEELIVWERR